MGHCQTAIDTADGEKEEGQFHRSSQLEKGPLPNRGRHSDVRERIRYRSRLIIPKGRTSQEVEVRQKRILANIGLVPYILRKNYTYGEEIDEMDLLQEGNLGLIYAVERFDESKGFRFSSYAVWWIRLYISLALSKQTNSIRIPVYKKHEIKRISRSRQVLEENLEHEPTAEEIAESLHITTKKVNTILSTPCYEVISLDSSLPSGDGSLLDVFVDTLQSDPEREVARSFLKDYVQVLLRRLTTRERQVLELRYGLSIDPNLVISRERKIGSTRWWRQAKSLGISYEAVRKAEKRGLGKLLPLCQEYSLDLYLP